MNIHYSFLTDEVALMEIRKHKWIESEKKGEEIGFATAAVDWIKKYGETFKQYRLGMANQQNIFSEKRRFRRFKQRMPLSIRVNNDMILSHTSEINLIGFSCRLPHALTINTQADITIHFLAQESFNKAQTFKFSGQVRRSSTIKDSATLLPFEVFIPFNEEIRDYLKKNVELMAV